MTLGKTWFLIFSFFRHWLLSEDKYSLQSSEIYKLYTGLLEFLKNKPQGEPQIEQFRSSLLQNNLSIPVEDFGAGSMRVSGKSRTVFKIAKYSTSSARYALLYQYFCQLTPAQYVIELGTCLGISTRYLSQVTQGRLYTFEGSAEIQKLAMNNFPSTNTEFVLGQIQKTLPEKLNSIPNVDFALIDANHTYQGTMLAWNQLKCKLTSTSIIAVADIHWSGEMTNAWEEIKTDQMVTLSLDFFECGVLLFNYTGPKTHLILAI